MPVVMVFPAPTVLFAKLPLVSLLSETLSPPRTPFSVAPLMAADVLPSYTFVEPVVPVTVNVTGVMFTQSVPPCRV